MLKAMCSTMLNSPSVEIVQHYTHPSPSTQTLQTLRRLLSSNIQLSNLAFARTPQSPLLEHVLDKRLTRLVTRAHERARRAVQEAQLEGALAPEFELVGGDVFVDGHVALGGAHVLAKGYDVDVVGAEF